MAELKGTKTHENLKHAFAGESQANRRYLYFRRQRPISKAIRRSRATSATLPRRDGDNAHGHMDYLKPAGDPATGLPFGSTSLNLKSAIEGETYEYTQMYPGSRRPPGKKASPRSPTGSRRSRAPRSRTRTASRSS